jgi:hypothetical protein
MQNARRIEVIPKRGSPVRPEFAPRIRETQDRGQPPTRLEPVQKSFGKTEIAKRAAHD